MLPNKEEQQLKSGLKCSVEVKNKNTKKLLAANMERVAERADNSLDQNQVENYNEFMCAYTDIFTNNIFATKDYIYHNLKYIIRDKDLVLLNGDKDFSVVVAKNAWWWNYQETTDNTLKRDSV